MSSSAIKAGEAYVEISARDQRFRNSLEANRIRMQGFVRQVALLGSAAALSAAAVGIQAASDVEETMNKFNVVFGENREAMKAWADDFARDVGRSKREVAEFLAGTQDLLIPVGLDQAAAEQMSQQITSLAVDVASFNNKLDADVLRDFHSALTGGGETVKKYGVVLDVAATKSKLLSAGIDPAAATNAQKVWARWQIILEATTAAQGDALRSSDVYANQMKRLQGQLEDTAAAVGSALLPVASELLQTINAGLIPLSEWIAANPELTRGIVAVAGATLTAVAAAKALNFVLALVAKHAAMTQLMMGPAGWVTLAISLAAVSIAFSDVSESIDNLDSTPIEAAGHKVGELRRELDELDDDKVVKVSVEREATPDPKDQFAKIHLDVVTDELDKVTDKIRTVEVKTQAREFRDTGERLDTTAAKISPEIDLTAAKEEVTQYSDLILELNGIEVTVEGGSIDAGANAMRRLAAASELSDQANKATNDGNLQLAATYHELSRQTAAAAAVAMKTVEINERHAQAMAKAKAAAYATSTAEISKLMEAQKGPADKLADALAVIAKRQAMIDRDKFMLNRDKTFKTEDLTELRDSAIEKMTGFADEIRRVNDELAMMDGTLTETDQKLAKFADKGLNEAPEKLEELRKKYAELDLGNARQAIADLRESINPQSEIEKLEQQIETTIANAKLAPDQAEELRGELAAVKNDKLQDRAEQLLADLQTPQERAQAALDELKKETQALVDAKVLERTEAEAIIASKQKEAEADIVSRDKSKDQQLVQESSNDVRSAEGFRLIGELISGRGSAEKQIAKATATTAKNTGKLLDKNTESFDV